MADESFRRIFGAGNKVHKRAKAPSRRGTEKMQAWKGGLQCGTETGETINNVEPLENARTQKAIAGDVNTVTGAQDYMVSQPTGVVTEGQLDLSIDGNSGGYYRPWVDWDAVQAFS